MSVKKQYPIVERHPDPTYYPITVEDDAGEYIGLSWADAARLVGALQAELQDYELEVQAQRESRAAATIPPVPAS